MLELPHVSKSVIAAALLAQLAAICLVVRHSHFNVWLAAIAFLLSGFLADLFTGLMHFGFDYVFSEDTPILGPIAREFREHHEDPILDPSNYVGNFTRGSYGTLLVAAIVCVLCLTLPNGAAGFLVIATLMGMCVWGFFFHQIHCYAHMDSRLAPAEFARRIEEIGRLATKRERKRELDRLIDTVPIPRLIRALQRCHIILDPGAHNLHHLGYETDFSSVNGWSDPFVNWILRRLARRCKARSPTRCAVARQHV